MVVGHGPVDETEEGIERSRHHRQEITHRGDDTGRTISIVLTTRLGDSLSEDEGDGPDENGETNPDSPSDDGMRVDVSRVSENSSVHEFTSDVGVDGADDDCGEEDKGEGRLSGPWLGERADNGCSGILAQEVVPNSGGDTEEDELHDGKRGKGFRKIGWVFHLGDERGV